MADILIRGMEMPTKGNPLTVLVYPDGTATWKDREYEAVELPPHGDLIERVQTLRAINNCDIPDGVSEHDFYEVIASVHEAMEKVPVIVPADKEGSG